MAKTADSGQSQRIHEFKYAMNLIEKVMNCQKKKKIPKPKRASQPSLKFYWCVLLYCFCSSNCFALRLETVWPLKPLTASHSPTMNDIFSFAFTATNSFHKFRSALFGSASYSLLLYHRRHLIRSNAQVVRHKYLCLSDTPTNSFLSSCENKSKDFFSLQIVNFARRRTSKSLLEFSRFFLVCFVCQVKSWPQLQQ